MHCRCGCEQETAGRHLFLPGHDPRYASLTERFWRRVDRDQQGCWLWKGTTIGHGYGSLANKGRPVYAHRLSWEIHYGPIPPGIFVCHHCDVRNCVRPDHLFLGTHLDNVRDMLSKGRMGQQIHPERYPKGDAHYSRTQPQRLARGEHNANSKITEDDVRTIRARRAAGETMVSLGAEYGMSPTAIMFIVKRRNWAHVE